MQVLVVVDMQNDFIDGALGTQEAVSIVPNVIDKIKNFDGYVLYTRDTHDETYLNTEEGKHLPIEHCIKGSNGWELHPEIHPLCKECPIDKPTFGSPKLGQILTDLNTQETINSVTLIGLCTDICVIANALLIKSFLPNTKIIVDSSCCAGVTPESHQRALSAMQMCHINVI